MKHEVTAIVTAMTDHERPWVQPAIASVLSQTVTPSSLVLMVESNNNWIEQDIGAAEYPPELLRRIAIHRVPIAPVGAVRNTGVNLASTNWVAFLDGDDLWKTRRLELQLAAALRNPAADFIAGDQVFVDAKGRPFAYSNGSTPTPSSWLVKRALMLSYPFDQEIKVGEDYFWLKATQQSCIRVRVPEIVVGYRIRGMSISALQHGHSRQRKFRETMARVASLAPLRLGMLGATYLRYLLYRKTTYEL